MDAVELEDGPVYPTDIAHAPAARNDRWDAAPASDPRLWVTKLDANATVSELKAAVLAEPWFDTLIAGKPGLMLQGGSMLGVSTQVWAVKDRVGNERAVCGLETEALTRKAELEREAKEELARRKKAEGSVEDAFSVELVWDSPLNCACASAMGYGAVTASDRGLVVEVGSNGELTYSRGAKTRVPTVQPHPLRL